YSWLLGLAMLVFKPSAYWEFSVVRLVNFTIFLGALAAFEFFLGELLKHQEAKIDGDGDVMGLPRWSWRIIGYALFLYTSLMMNRVSRTSPDVCVSAFVYLSAGICLRIRRGRGTRLAYGLLGVVLALAYLTKAGMFPLAFIFMGVSLFLYADARKALPRVLVTLLTFLLVACPFVFALSKAKGRLTVGDTGKLNYAWHVNGVTTFIHWQGEGDGNGAPLHPSRKIFDSPAVYEFATPVGGSYPPWYDPGYWYEGVETHFHLRRQARVLLRNLLGVYSTLFLIRIFLGGLTFGLLILFIMGGRGRRVLRDVSAYWFLYVPSVLMIALYLLVHVEDRYLAPFVVLIFAGLFGGVRLPNSETSRRLVLAVTLSVGAMFTLSILPTFARAGYRTVSEVVRGRAAQNDAEWQVADALTRNGIRAGDSVASIGNTMFASWHRLSRVRVVAEISQRSGGEVEKFWRADESLRGQVVEAFKRTGARAIVAENTGNQAVGGEWQRVGTTNYYVLYLKSDANREP
ncbi:MAG TPA: hypothetical protein VJT82_06990, partial [Pyrinomonadaceae bacterium]|nr:hypothetical protein [Pyrinomonadaceae bacterium]